MSQETLTQAYRHFFSHMGIDPRTGDLSEHLSRTQKFACYPHIAGTYSTALRYACPELGWDRFADSRLTCHRVLRAGRDLPETNPLSFIAFTNFHKWVTKGARKTVGARDRVTFDRKLEEELFWNEVRILRPDLVVFQSAEYAKPRPAGFSAPQRRSVSAPLRPGRLARMLSRTSVGEAISVQTEERAMAARWIVPSLAARGDSPHGGFIRGLGLVGVLAALTLHPTPASPQVPPETEARLRSIFEAGDFNARSFQATWLPNGSGYTTLEAPPGASQRELVRYDAATGDRTVLVSLSHLTPYGRLEPLRISGYQFAPDGSWVLLQTGGDGSWMFEWATSTLKQVEAGGGNAISPHGGRILFGRGGDLHVHDLEGGQTTRLTWTTAESVSNGRAVWSPDGNRVAFVQSDASGVRMRSMLIPNDPSYPELREVRFARVGETIANLRVGVVDAEGREVRWVSIPSPNEGFYLGQVNWAGNSEELLVEQFSRFRDERDFFIANVTTGEVKRIYHESDPAWVIASYRLNAGLEWIRGGDSFLFLTEKDGWRHSYVYSRDGREERLLTPGPSDVMERGPVDEGRGWLYFFASPDNATQRYLYRVRLDGAEGPERVTPEAQPGTHFYDFSPDLRWAFHTYSTFDTPPVTALVSLPDHRVVRVLEDNAQVRRRAEATISHPTEFLELDIGDGVAMDAWMIKPRDFDPSRQYPVFIYVYGEPHGQTVLDRWSTRNNYHRAIADLGYLVVSIENRGTPAPKGAAWRRAPFPTIGVQSTEEHAAGVRELGRMLRYVDLSRVGIWGWSGGGSNTLNSLFRRPDVYHVGIAVVPKPQPHLYNAWFQEIYMETLETNPDGYRVSAPINYAEGLEGDLLIIHGTGETNTHLEIVEGLVDRLVELGKTFDYMTYPNRNHGLSEGEGTAVHLRMLMVRYLLEHLPAGAGVGG